MTDLPKYLIQYIKYKWEFLRRNPEYIKDWKNLEDELYGDWRPPAVEMTNKVVAFRKKWKITWPLSPENSYEYYTTDIAKKQPVLKKNKSKDVDFDAIGVEVYNSLTNGIDLHRIMYECLYPEFFLPGRPLMVTDGWKYEVDGDTFRRSVSKKLAETGILSIKIDLKSSKNRLLKEFKNLLDDWKELYEVAYKNRLYEIFCTSRKIISHSLEENVQKEFMDIYKKELNERQKKYETKFHFDNFELYLKVYDMRQEGTSWSEITSTLGLNSIQTPRNHYNSALELIKKGVELYVK